jgi:hypothetical protein
MRKGLIFAAAGVLALAAGSAQAAAYRKLSEDEIIQICQKAVGPEAIEADVGQPVERGYARMVGVYTLEVARRGANPADVQVVDTLCSFYMRGARDETEHVIAMFSKPGGAEKAAQLAAALPVKP